MGHSLRLPDPTHGSWLIPFNGKRQRLAAVDAMRHDRAEQNSKPQAMRQPTREAFMKRAITGIVAAVLAMSATAALAQSKPPLKLGGILDMSEPLRRYHRAGLGDRRENGGRGFWWRSAGPQGRDRRGRSSEQGRPFRQHRPRHAGQSGRRDAVRRRGVRHRARRRRDCESAQQDRDYSTAPARSGSATRPAAPIPCIMCSTPSARPM